MATSSDGGGGDQRRLLSIPKEGERIIAPTRRPDGSLRKPIRIRAGYVPQEEVAIYQSKGALVSPSGPSFLGLPSFLLPLPRLCSISLLLSGWLLVSCSMQMRKSGSDVPPGCDPALAADAKPKTKAAKRNERRKEKRQQVGPLSLSSPGVCSCVPLILEKPRDLDVLVST
jgi:partner of Y14 and mago protein